MELDAVKKLVEAFEESLAKPAVAPVVPTGEAEPPAAVVPDDDMPCLNPDTRDLLVAFIEALPACESVS